ncbi:MAG: hypothetical protein ACYC5M_09540 [Anaerolineae bacterium]
MEISVADERALLLKEQLSLDQAEGRAWSHKAEAFGTLVRVTSLLQRPKDSDFQLLYKEFRYQPFWHIVCHAVYRYTRRRQFPFDSGPEVFSLTIDGKDYATEDGRLSLSGVEHCREDARQELYVEGITGERVPALANYLQYAATEIPRDDLDEFAPSGTIVVPPQARASGIVREVLAGMIKNVQADQILEETVQVERVDLYYRPVYAFQYRWVPRDKEAIVEYDGLTGDLQSGGKTFKQYMGKVLDPEFLFDVGAEAADLMLPGGGLAVMLARKGLDAARNRGKETKPAARPGAL